MPLNISLVGVSGVLYWMGGSWLALYWLIDKRESKGRRVLKVIAVTIVLFVPDSYLPNISYISHFLGYFAGVFSGILYYLIFRNKILSAEVIEQISDEELDEEYYNEDEPNDPKDPLPSSSHSSQKE
jgi:rhomboid protease GluP